MIAKNAMLAAALSGLAGLAMAQNSFAADEAATEKCYGVAKAGKNDCASGKHACAGHSTNDGAGAEWVKLPKGTCERLVGGSLKSKAK